MLAIRLPRVCGPLVDLPLHVGASRQDFEAELQR
jgi:hypothetical protein